MCSTPKVVSFAIAATLSHAHLAAGPESSDSPETTSPAAERKLPLWAPSVQTGYLRQFDTDIDNRGSLSVDRANLRVGVTRIVDRKRFVGVSFGYGYDGYRFSDPAVDPWSDIHTLGLAMPILWSLNDSWDLFALPTIRSSMESGASFSDSLRGGILTGVSYRFGENLSLGPGLGVLTQIEDDASIFPFLLVQWKITESLMLETGRGFGASQGPGLSLNWQATDRWKFSLGSRRERSRFRLDDTGIAPDGVGEDEGVPVYFGASFATSEFSELSVYVGAKFGGSITLEDSSGRVISSSDHDTAPFAGITWSLGF